MDYIKSQNSKLTATELKDSINKWIKINTLIQERVDYIDSKLKQCDNPSGCKCTKHYKDLRFELIVTQNTIFAEATRLADDPRFDFLDTLFNKAKATEPKLIHKIDATTFGEVEIHDHFDFEYAQRAKKLAKQREYTKKWRAKKDLKEGRLPRFKVALAVRDETVYVWDVPVAVIMPNHVVQFSERYSKTVHKYLNYVARHYGLGIDNRDLTNPTKWI